MRVFASLDGAPPFILHDGCVDNATAVVAVQSVHAAASRLGKNVEFSIVGAG